MRLELPASPQRPIAEPCSLGQIDGGVGQLQGVVVAGAGKTRAAVEDALTLVVYCHDVGVEGLFRIGGHYGG
ncbi:hypothetical protein PG985_010853 [Apiospora marii]|uniref:uncharacterized protein n=1 Tax=Apiospora marii TaxID=335849 RepID=UPI00312E2858